MSLVLPLTKPNQKHIVPLVVVLERSVAQLLGHTVTIAKNILLVRIYRPLPVGNVGKMNSGRLISLHTG